MDESPPVARHGPLAHVLVTRTGADAAAGIRLEHREALVYTLGKAAELEHLIMLTYLFAAASLKTSEAEGLTAEQVEATRRWRKALNGIAHQEMLHLSLVQNMLTAVGAAPRLARPNFPIPRHLYPSGIDIRLLPFSEAAIRHFAYLERPEGMAFDDAEGQAALERSMPETAMSEDDIAPRLQDFDTIGGLYRAIEVGFETIADRLGAERLFIGPPRAQATEAHFRWPELVPVIDVASARRAIDTIVEQGEGARGEWRDAHFGTLIGILDELVELQAADPTFEPARPVVAAHVRPTALADELPVVEDPGTARAMDLLNVVNEVLLQVLSRYFAHTDETDEQLAVLAEVAVGLMFTAVSPLASAISKQPIRPFSPETAGPTFELFYDVDYLLPHRDAAWLVMEERLREAAAFATRCREACVIELLNPLGKVATALVGYADRLAAAAAAAAPPATPD